MHRLLAMFADSTRDEYLRICEEILLQQERRVRFEPTRAWASRFPKAPGVYAVFEGDELAYVGESGSLRGRMIDLQDSRNHTLRRTIGHRQFGSIQGFERASASRRFPPSIEEQLAQHMTASLAITAVETPFGRREIEEHMVAKYAPRFNLKGRRA